LPFGLSLSETFMALLFRGRSMVLVSLFLAVPSYAYTYNPYSDPYAQAAARQKREWQATTNHYNSLAHSNSSSRNNSGVAPFVWKSQTERLAEWNQTLARLKADADARDAADRAWKAHVAEYERKLNARTIARNEEIAEVRRRNEENRQKLYAEWTAKTGGMGTKLRPPSFATLGQAFRWHLEQAHNGDAYGAFYIGRALMEGSGVAKNHNHALLWLEKSNPEWPLTQTLIGSLLVNGEGIQPDPQRGRALLEKGALHDETGISAWIYGNILRNGAGLPTDPDGAAQQLRRAVYWSGQLDPYARFSPRLESWPPVGEWEARALRIRADFAALVAEHPDRVPAWMQEWTKTGTGAVRYTFDVPLLEKSLLAALPKISEELRLRCLDEIEKRDAPELLFLRQEVLQTLLKSRQPQVQARALLPWRARGAGDTYFHLLAAPDDAQRLWEAGGAQVEAWAQEQGHWAERARRALLARDLGSWPSVSSLQPPAVVIARFKAHKDLPVLLEEEIRAAVQQGRSTWSNAEAMQKWVSALAAIDTRFEPTRRQIAVWQETEKAVRRARDFDERVQRIRTTLEKREGTWTNEELDNAAAEFDKAEKLRDSDPDAALEGLFKAFEGGDALAPYQLLAMMNGPVSVRLGTGQFKNNQQYLVDTYNVRLQRDAAGTGSRAATAALALHLLHRNPDDKTLMDVAFLWKNRWRASYRPTQVSSRDWLQVAKEKGHPLLTLREAQAAPILNAHLNRDGLKQDTAFWQWLSQNGATLSQSMEIWRRDHRVLGVFAADGIVANLQSLLDVLEAANLDARQFLDIAARLESARLLCATYAATPNAFDFQKAQEFRDAAEKIRVRDDQENSTLPALRSQLLEAYVQATLHGDAEAPLLVAQLLEYPVFPLRPDHDEAVQWAKLARERLAREAEKAPPERAAWCADLLSSELESDTFLPVDEMGAKKYRTLAANLGFLPAAQSMATAHEEGWPGYEKNAQAAARWKRIAEQIEAETYKVPPEFLAGRDKS
jgi:TPR repeat protein